MRIVLQVRQQVHEAGYMCDVDCDPGTTLNKKIRNAQLAQYNFIFGMEIQHFQWKLMNIWKYHKCNIFFLENVVVGEKELATGTVNVRTRNNTVHGEHSVDAIIERFHRLQCSRQNIEDDF